MLARPSTMVHECLCQEQLLCGYWELSRSPSGAVRTPRKYPICAIDGSLLDPILRPPQTVIHPVRVWF